MAATITPITERERVRNSLVEGGRVRVTVQSKETGRHLTVRLACKAKGPNGRYISRARLEGRVGYEQADAVFADGGDPAFSGWVGTYYPRSGKWYPAEDAQEAPGSWYGWAAQAVIAWAMGEGDLEQQAEVSIEAECSSCGRALTDPESIERGIGPECYGRHTKSEHATAGLSELPG